jgi:predicted dehydrogenase
MCGEDCPDEEEAGAFIGGSSSHDIWYIGHQRNIADMVAAIQQGRPPAITGEEGRKALEIVLAVYESARTGKTVVFGE